jgi:hypothetical protein
LSPPPPPLAEQLVALADDQVNVVEPPTVIVAGAAEIVVVTAGHDHTTCLLGLTSGAPGAEQTILYASVPGAASVNTLLPLAGMGPWNVPVSLPAMQVEPAEDVQVSVND